MKAISKEATVPIQLGLLITLIVGVFALSRAVSSWEQRLDDFERRFGGIWTFQMTKDTWNKAEKMNPGFKSPDVSQIWQENIYSSK